MKVTSYSTPLPTALITQIEPIQPSNSVVRVFVISPPSTATHWRYKKKNLHPRERNTSSNHPKYANCINSESTTKRSHKIIPLQRRGSSSLRSSSQYFLTKTHRTMSILRKKDCVNYTGRRPRKRSSFQHQSHRSRGDSLLR